MHQNQNFLPYQTYAMNIGMIFFTLLGTVTVYLAMIRNPLIDWMRERAEKKEPTAPEKENLLNEKEARDIYMRWKDALASEHWYLLEEGFPLTRAAKKMGVPARKLSQAVNRFYGASYSQMINDYRIGKAKTLLKQDLSMPISEVMLSSGFSTKSQFHREFSRVTGVSPSVYRLPANNN